MKIKEIKMNAELIERPDQGMANLTARQIRQHVNLIAEVMKEVMKQGTHFGIIPGCPKPSLFKPGAEKIAVTFRIAVTTEVEDLSTSDYKKYRVTCTAYAQDGTKLGSAVGTASSNETKYQWRKPVCDQEFEECEIDRKREKWINTKTEPIKIKQIKTECDDLDNTILQMADKRAYVAVVRKVTAASDVFTQDIEDLPAEVQADIVAEAQTSHAGKPAVAMPQEKQVAPAAPKQDFSKAKNPISEPQGKRLYAIRKSVNYPDKDFQEWLMFTHNTDDRNIERETYDAIVAHVQGYKANV